MQSTDHLLRWLERISIFIAAVMLFATMMVATVDVFMRYFFNAPLGWSYDLISLYLMAGIFYFALSDTLFHHGHIAVDLLHARMSRRTRHAVEVPGYLIITGVFAAISILTMQRTWESYQGGDVISGRIDWPTWISMAFVAWGYAVLTLRCVHRLVGHALSAVHNRSVIELPPIAGLEDV